MTYGSDTRHLLVDVGLNFERDADDKMDVWRFHERQKDE